MKRDAAKHEIAGFFDEMSATRNDLFRTHPVLDYEQHVRSRAVLDALAAGSGERILDIGCGNARDIIPMLRAGATIAGVDLSEGMIREAERDLVAAGYTAAELEVGDATRLRFPDESFDKILCSEVIEHIPDADSAVQEMFRVLKPGGRLVMSTPNRRSWYGFDRYVLYEGLLRRRWNHPFDNWRTLPELKALLERHGLSVAASRTVCYVPGFLLTYRLPLKPLQHALVGAVRASERVCALVAPRNGYLLVASAVKKRLP